MGQYAIRRVLLLVPTLLTVYTITFLLIHATPGGPWDTGDKPISQEAIDSLNKAYGLDKPMWRQYVDYLGGAVRLDFGPSYAQRNRDVTDIMRDFVPVSLKLGIAAMVVAAIVGITAGTIGAVRRNTAIDYFSTFGAIVGVSAPSYVVASLLILILASRLHWLPTGGWDGIFSKQAIIPTIALSFSPAAALARYTRSSLIEVLQQDYVRTARAKGLAEISVIGRHALRNALIPVVTILGLQFAAVATGSFFVETVCGVPGIGRYFVRSIAVRDYPVILATTLLFAVAVSVMNLIVDLMYGLLDPRINY